MPGEIFSFNRRVGRRTRAAGFTDAPGFAGGRVVDMLRRRNMPAVVYFI